MPELLLEFFSEEIPARMQNKAAQDLLRLVGSGLKAEGLDFANPRAFATPRRLTLVLDGVPARSPDIEEERKGPRVGAPEKAIAGFLKAAGLASLDDCETRQDKKGAYYVAIRKQAGRPAAEVIAQVVRDAVTKMPWPKAMRWGAGNLRWVRPLHSILCLHDGKTVPFEIDGIVSGNVTYGHRFMAPEPITVHDFADYVEKLQAAKVMLDPAKRAETILTTARKIAHANGLELIEDAALLAETAGLAEWPVVLMGTFAEDFLDVPPEVLITAMKKHQKCFALSPPRSPRQAAHQQAHSETLACSLNFRAENRLANRFVLVANLEAKDGGKAIIAGNERVIRARLSDAKFFWEQDRGKDLEKDFLPQLDHITFHAKLGSQGERVRRIEAMARDIAPFVDADPDEAALAARLCKADLVSEMVGEFPDLQGLMGKYYALGRCHKPPIAQAIEDHYKPQGPSDAVPADPIAIAVALADKLDMLAGFWSIDEKPTGSKDPYALRRAALGVIRILLENKIRYPLSIHADDDLLAFFADRLKVYLRDRGARHDLIDAVFALGNQDDLLMIVKRVEALGAFLATPDGENLLAGVKRASNILRIEEKKEGRSFEAAPNPELLQQPEEKALFEAVITVSETAGAAIDREDFEAAMAELAKLRAPVDAFFDQVTVNADDLALRENRLRLLNQIRQATRKVADFSRIAG